MTGWHRKVPSTSWDRPVVQDVIARDCDDDDDCLPLNPLCFWPGEVEASAKCDVAVSAAVVVAVRLGVVVVVVSGLAEPLLAFSSFCVFFPLLTERAASNDNVLDDDNDDVVIVVLGDSRDAPVRRVA